MTSILSPVTRGRLVCGVVLLRAGDGAALLQHRDEKPGLPAAGRWVFPGGHCEPGEDLLACALREFEEETCYRCRDPRWLVSLPDCFDPSWEPYELVLFWDVYDGLQPVECREGQALEFVARTAVDTIGMADYLRSIWDLALRRKSAWWTRPAALASDGESE